MFGLETVLAQTEPTGFVFWVDRLARAPLSKVVLLVAALTLVRVSVWPILAATREDERGTLYSLARIVNEVTDAVVYAGMIIFMIVRPFGFQTFYIPTGSMIDTLLLNDYIVANKLAYRLGEPQRGDVVVFKPPKRALNPGQADVDFIKRLIGKPGDIIEWRQKTLYRNGVRSAEPYVDYTFPGNPDGPVVPKSYEKDIQQADFKLIQVGDRYIPLQYTETTVNQMGVGEPPIDDGLSRCADEFVPRNPEEARYWKSLPAAAIPPGYLLFMGDNRNGSSDGRSWGLAERANVIAKSEFVWFPLSRLHPTR